ncbi:MULTISPECIES: alpha/beta fold hydrolase [Marinobacter]|uniref:Alpha/beta hydrolase n=1 Tax=Marinobacter suaedae TaxID=3057675 RepID=A0ABT8W159_9GAMM|nr:MULTISPECIES: alpha/beta hydrolase [unclassified Marinobacter]MBZ2169936.1 alpha/beta hydrolase [Marinobacter sp. F4216]MDO3721916.1 alpha/beta hydrolase [Marinobacter sp. chi1]
MSSEHTLTINQQLFHYHETAEGEPVVMLHCSGGDHRQWKGMEHYLTQHRFITPDFAGYGRSVPFTPWRGDDNPDLRMVTQILEGLDQPCHLVGHSYGGGKALQAAIRVPWQVKTLTLIDPAAIRVLNKPDGHSASFREFCSIGDAITQYMRSGACSSAAKQFFGFWQGLDDQFESAVPVQPEQIACMKKIFHEFSELMLPDYSARDMASLTMPVHLIKGERTKPIVHDVIDDLVSRVAVTRQTIVPGAGHLLPLTHRAPTFQAVSDFISTHSVPDPVCVDAA